MQKIFVMNLGSTSFKFKLFQMHAQEVLMATGSVDAIGSGRSRMKIQTAEDETKSEWNCPTHEAAFHACMDFLKEKQLISGIRDVDAVGYKAVLAGDISGVQTVTPELIEKMEMFVPLAPAHNPVYIMMMKQIMQSDPQLKQYACFETSFHSTIPLKRAVYGVPIEWLDWGIRRYGFHGASHSYIAQTVREQYPDANRIVSVHLGGSCSICAILEGKSVESSMGLSLQSGLFHNNRVGDFDIFALPLLAERLGGLQNVLDALGTKSGFLGLSGVSNDLRLVQEAADAGNPNAILSRDAFCDQITGYIGMDSAYMGGLDTIVFTGGIGQHSAFVRKKSLETLGYLGVKLDDEANAENRTVISAADSRVRVLVLETNEELMIARQIASVISQD